MYELEEVKAQLDQGTLSRGLHMLKILANSVGNKDLSEWANHELEGYSGIGADNIPDYRNVLVQWQDARGMPYRVGDPRLNFLAHEKIVSPIIDIEVNLEIGMRFAPKNKIESIEKNLGYSLNHYDILPNELKKVLEKIKLSALERLASGVKKRNTPKVYYSQPNFSLLSTV